MKQVVISLVILGLITGMGLWVNDQMRESAQHLVTHIDIVADEIKYERWTEAMKRTERLEEAWSNRVGWWPIILDHQEIDNIEFSLAKIKEYVANRDKPLSLGQLSELKLMIEHIPDKEAVTLKNIL